MYVVINKHNVTSFFFFFFLLPPILSSWLLSSPIVPILFLLANFMLYERGKAFERQKNIEIPVSLDQLHTG